MTRERITEDWLRSVGFKWAQFDRQPEKHWILWIGNALLEEEDKPKLWRLTDFEDLGIEIAFNGPGKAENWYCWLRSDTAGRYHRFIHIRHLVYQDELIGLVQGLTGRVWDPANHLYGSVYTPEHAAGLRAEKERRKQRADLISLEQGHPWYEHEKDPDRSRPLPDHVDAARKGGLAK